MSNENETENTVPVNFRYRDDNGKMISKEAAIEKRWAYKGDGSPTKIYQHRLAIREAEKNGTERPVREKKTYDPGSQSHANVPSPYDLKRRSGYRVIWQVLAENVGDFVGIKDLTTTVIARLKVEAPDWYERRYSETPYDVETNAYVMTRAPYNAHIEAMSQRVVKEDEGFKLMTDVTEPRQLKKRGRKPNKVEVTPVLDANVEADDDASVTVNEGEVVTV